jgi:hypothetical protein
LKFNTVNAPLPLTPFNSNFLGTGTTTLFSWEALKGGVNYQMIIDTNANFNAPLKIDTVLETTSISLKNLLFRPLYYWKVRAVTSNDTSNWSETWVCKVLPARLNYPKNNITNLSLTSLDWNSITGTTGYILEVDTNANFNQPWRTQDTATNSFFHYFMETPALIGFNTKCYWRVKLFHETDTSDWSTVWNFTTKPRRAPTLVSPADSSINSSIFAKLTWQAYSGASSYAVHYGMKPDLSDAVKTTSTGTNITVNLKANTRYYWRVRGRNSDGNEFYDFSETWTFVTDEGIPKPSLVSPANNAENQALNVLFSWAKFAQATGYRIEISTDKTFNLGVVAKDASTTFATFNHLQEGTTYYWRVKTISGSLESPWSEVWSLTMKAQNSVKDLTHGNRIKIFPNPSDGIYQISYPIGVYHPVKVTDAVGKEIYRFDQGISNGSKFDLTHLPKGVYFVQLLAADAIIMVPIVRN